VQRQRAPADSDPVLLPARRTAAPQPHSRMSAAETAGDAPLVSVVIVNSNGLHLLRRCIPALEATAGPCFETIVVDNGSSDGSAQWLQREHPAVRVLPAGAILGSGEGQRRAAELARGEFIAFLDNDTVVEAGWLVPLVAVLSRHADVGAACSLLELLSHPGVLDAAGGGMTWLGIGFERSFGVPAARDESDDCVARIESVLFPTAAAMLMRKREFQALGGSDPALPRYHADLDLGWRIWLSGKRVVLCRDSVVHHDSGATSTPAWGPPLRARAGSRHNVRSLIKNYEARNVVRALAALHRIWWRQSKYSLLLEAWRWNLPRLRQTLEERRRVQRSRRVSDDELFAAGLILRDCGPSLPRIELPLTKRDALAEKWLPSSLLLPGEDAALARLGPGWFAPEVREGRRIRWTCGLANCCMLVEPEARGRLEVELHPPESPLTSAEVTLSCNGRRRPFHLSPAGWQTVQLEAAADAGGLLAIELRTSGRGVPSPTRPEQVGCAVRQLRFVAEAPAPVPAHQTISVVIPTHNRADILEQTLAALRQQSRLPEEVVVVDDGSTDETWQRLSTIARDRSLPYQLTIQRQENAGPGPARNVGVQLAAGDLVLFLGDDTVPEEDCVKEHLLRHQQLSQTAAVVGHTGWRKSTMRVTPFLELVNSEGYQFGYGHLEDGRDTPFTCFYTSNISAPRWLLREEPFHPSFHLYGWEDTELGYRLALRGLRIIYCQAARTQHHHPMSVTGFLRRQRLVGECSETIYELHPSLRSSRQMLPATFPVEAYARLERFLRCMIPAIDLLDRAGIPLPARFYRYLLLSSYCRGITDARELPRAGPVRSA